MTNSRYDELVAIALGAHDRARAAETWAARLAVTLWVALGALATWSAARGLWFTWQHAPAAVTLSTGLALTLVAVPAWRACRLAAAWSADALTGYSAAHDEAVAAMTDILVSYLGLTPTVEPGLDDFTGAGVHVYDAARRTTKVTLDLSDGTARVRFWPYQTRLVTLD